MEDAGTATVPEIHPKELGDRLGVVVFDEGFGGWIIGLVGDAVSLGWCRDWNLGGVGGVYEAVGA